MDSIPEHRILKFKPNTLEEVRRMHSLDKKRMTESIEALENWIKKQDHLMKKDFSREYLERTIITCKGSVERAKQQIDKMCTLRTLLPNFFTKLDLQTDLKAVTEKALLLPLPKMTKNFERIFIVKLNVKDLLPSDIIDYFRLSMVMVECLKAHDYVNGFIVINDYREVNLMDVMTKMNLSELQQFMTILTEGYGARLLGLYIITTSKVVDLFIKTLKQFIKPKVASRLHAISSVEDIYAVVDKTILPIDYGGEEKPVNELIHDWLEELGSEEHQDYMRMMSAAGTDESRRKLDKFNEEYLGMAGTFRKINVD